VLSRTTGNSLRRLIHANYGSHSIINCFFVLPEIKVARSAWKRQCRTLLFGGEQKSLIELFKLSLFCFLFFPLVWQFLFDFTVSWPFVYQP